MIVPDKTRVLFVDDNVNLLSAVKRVLRKQIDLVTAESGAEAIAALEAGGAFAVLVSDQNMPNMRGDALLAEAAKRWPMMVRVMLTGNDDQATAALAVNSGQVFRFVRKPCDPDTLLEIINSAAAHHRMITAEKQLLEKTLSGSVKVMSDMLATLRPDLFNRTAKVRKGARLVAVRMGLPRAWELDLAAMLYPLGLIALPDAVAAKYANGEVLEAAEQSLIDHSTEMASKLISNIPRLENVVDGVRFCCKGYDGSGYPAEGAKGPDLPLISRILRILIDLVNATETGEATLKTAGDFLKKKPHLYDPELLYLVIEILDEVTPATSGKDMVKIEVVVGELLEGDIISKDILNVHGRLLLSAGAELTTVTIQRIENLARIGELIENIAVSRALKPEKRSA